MNVGVRVDIAKVESSLLKGFREYMDSQGFIEVQVPHITKATGACENVATMFYLDYFGRRAYLTQTAQLHLEVLSQVIDSGKVYTLIRSFRAEPEVDNRHMTEFSLFEFEHIGGFDELLKHIENTIYYGVVRLLEERMDIVNKYGVDEDWLEQFKPPYKRMRYVDVINFLREKGFELNYGDDLKYFHEKVIAEEFGPTFITHWPKKLKFFNMREDPENPDEVISADLELPFVGESVGSAEREYRYKRLFERLVESDMYRMLTIYGGDVRDWDWYLEFWRTIEEPVLHSGCGIGVSRVVQSILRLESVKDATVYPMDRLTIY
jgi:asparaginyl-tRNA synthetase